MLNEIKNIKQLKNEPYRRWFYSTSLDLIIWQDNNTNIIGFQLCYKKDNISKALTWNIDQGFRHDLVDDGESFNKSHKMTPILIADGTFDKKKVIKEFQAKATEMDSDVAKFVIDTLETY